MRNIWIEPDWNVKEEMEEVAEDETKDLNRTRLECKGHMRNF